MKVLTSLVVAALLIGCPFVESEEEDDRSSDPRLRGFWIAEVADVECAVMALFERENAFKEVVACVPASGSERFYMQVKSGWYWTDDGDLTLDPDTSSCPGADRRELRYRVSGDSVTMSWGTTALTLERTPYDPDNAPDDPRRLGQQFEIGCFDASWRFSPFPVAAVP